MKFSFPICAALVLSTTQLAADGHATGLSGATVVLTNTFQGAQTEGAEVDVAAFDLVNNRFASVGDGIEFPQFITLYDVDIASDSIVFTWSDSDFAKQLSGPTPEGNHDRNDFVFDLADGKAITAASFDAATSGLLDGSAKPKISVLGPNRIVVDFDGGAIRGAGFNPTFSITVE